MLCQGAIPSVLIQTLLLTFQVKKLKTELGVVRSNLTMMSDMMSQLDPVTVKQADMELLEVKTKTDWKRWKMSHVRKSFPSFILTQRALPLTDLALRTLCAASGPSTPPPTHSLSACVISSYTQCVKICRRGSWRSSHGSARRSWLKSCWRRTMRWTPPSLDTTGPPSLST